MILRKLSVRGFRCLADQEISLHPRMNWLIGGNAEGKTSLLEAAYWLGRGKSFRTNRPGLCIRSGASGWRVGARIERPDQPDDRVAIQYQGQALELTRNDRQERLVDHARITPVLLIEPGLHRVVEDGPGYRRRFLDWGMFHVEHGYLTLWRAYSRSLRQRNAALRERGAASTLKAWTQELAQRGEALNAARQSGMSLLQERFRERGRALGLPDVAVSLYPGWDKSESFAETLAARAETDRRQGVTSSGPHRAELRFSMNGEVARQHVSRGQQKLLIAALSLAQADVIATAKGFQPLLLLDDFTAELGAGFQDRLLAELAGYSGQSVISSLDAPGALNRAPEKVVFHVEQGQLRPVD